MRTEFIPFHEINSFQKNLFFLDYIQGKNHHFYRHDFSEKTIADIRTNNPLPEELGHILKDYNENYYSDKTTVQGIQALSKKEAGAVITGQQPHIYGSPLYTIYKILTAIITAENLSRKNQRSYVPVFWNASDDHDFSEINHAAFPDALQGVMRFHLDFPYTGEPIYAYQTGQEFSRLNVGFISGLKQTEFTTLVNEYISLPVNSPAEQMTNIIKRLFAGTGLVIVEPRLLRNHCKEIYREIALNDRAINAEVNETGSKTGNFIIRDHSSNLFYLGNNKREKIRFDNSSVNFQGKAISQQEFADYVFHHPEQFSPNAAVRPVVQDVLFPTVCYIGGPGECNYFSQLKPVYEILGVRMPVIKPRVSATILTPREIRIMEKYSLNAHDVLNNRTSISDHDETEKDTQYADDFIEKVRAEIERFCINAENINREIKDGLNSSVRKMEFELEKMKEKYIKGCEKSRGVFRGHITRLMEAILPGNLLQERVFTPLYYINLYGNSFIEKLQSGFDTEKNEHHFIYLD